MLLEVLLALVLFVAAAAIITASMNASLEGLDRQKLTMHASNLGASILAELELGSRTADVTGEQPFEEPFADWTWEVVLAGTETESGEVSELTQVEVILRRKDPHMVHRQAQLMKLAPAKSGSAPLTAAMSSPRE